jgi:branched-chain amino acid transport system ATP-binding protein
MLEVADLRVAYGQIEAVKGVSFRVPDGQIVTLVGANGAGKTTTLAAISGLLRPRAGRVTFDGRDLTRLGPHRIVGLGVVQVPEGRDILATMTVAENLELGAYHRRDRAAVRRDIARMCERFPILGERRAMPAGSLSGGEQQMLAIARGLMARPRVFLLDEPSMGLAPQLVREIFRIIADLKAEGNTILLVEQNARKALSICDYAYVMESGRITLQGTGDQLLHNDAMIGAYLGGTTAAAAPPPSAAPDTIPEPGSADGGPAA